MIASMARAMRSRPSSVRGSRSSASLERAVHQPVHGRLQQLALAGEVVRDQTARRARPGRRWRARVVASYPRSPDQLDRGLQEPFPGTPPHFFIDRGASRGHAVTPALTGCQPIYSGDVPAVPVTGPTAGCRLPWATRGIVQRRRAFPSWCPEAPSPGRTRGAHGAPRLSPRAPSTGRSPSGRSVHRQMVHEEHRAAQRRRPAVRLPVVAHHQRVLRGPRPAPRRRARNSRASGFCTPCSNDSMYVSTSASTPCARNTGRRSQPMLLTTPTRDPAPAQPAQHLGGVGVRPPGRRAPCAVRTGRRRDAGSGSGTWRATTGVRGPVQLRALVPHRPQLGQLRRHPDGSAPPGSAPPPPGPAPTRPARRRASPARLRAAPPQPRLGGLDTEQGPGEVEQHARHDSHPMNHAGLTARCSGRPTAHRRGLCGRRGRKSGSVVPARAGAFRW